MNDFSLISDPQDLKTLSKDNLVDYNDYVRRFLIDTITRVGGHLGSGLGVVELTIALHYVFNAPIDKIIWDTGHQTYPHKCLTGRMKLLETIRSYSGISGFTKISESIYDVFGAGHSSTALSAAIGIMQSKKILKKNYDVIAVIGDGALSAGLSFESFNNLHFVKEKMIIVINDNKMSIAESIGSFNEHLAFLRETNENCFDNLNCLDEKEKHDYFFDILNKSAQSDKKNIFEIYGALYIGIFDGHDLLILTELFLFLKNQQAFNCPIVVHVVTEKGKGLDDPANNKECYHAVAPSKKELSSNNLKNSYSNIFVNQLNKIAAIDETVVAITAAMPSGTGLSKFMFTDRLFDVGIAEQHAVTFSASMALYGLKPFCCIYSTFMQRAYDQIIHDVAIQSSPVRFIIDRAGLVGGDGETHNGCYDIMYFINLPNFIVMCPSSAYELRCMIKTAHVIDNAPSVVRFPKNSVIDDIRDCDIIPFEIGKAQVVRKIGNDLLILSIGDKLSIIENICDILFDRYKISVSIINVRFAKPIDADLILKFIKRIDKIAIVEEGVYAGFTSHIYKLILENNLAGKDIHSMCFPDRFISHGSINDAYRSIGMDEEGILLKLLEIVRAK
ncbi:1-deoxy-D-xylulose-5-phosphate synthase [Anaplasmataceae bacterium AB001_6]|nr:1-deoxy-D-xylulose-5-phosphate synthase [Anaplasmataceae bacterium AB001_6]